MTFPPELVIPTRTELVDQHLKFRRVANPLIDVSEGGEPFNDASVAADIQLPIIAQARRITNAAFPWTAQAADVPEWGDKLGVPPSPATGAIGFVKISASVGGGEIQQGAFLTIKDRSNGPRFMCQITGRYFDGDWVPITAYDTGRETNLPPGTKLTWSFPSPAGIGPVATVVDQDGEGLTGGRDESTAAEQQAAILDKLREPPGAENDAHYRFEARRLGVPVQQAFTYPAIIGAGSIGIVFTVFPTRRGGSRIPTGAQMRRIGAGLEYAFGADDSVLMTALVEYPVTVAYKIDWAQGAGGWASTAPWPRFYEGSAPIVIKAVTDALTFSVGTMASGYGGIVAPSVGKRIALFDRVNGRFIQKRISTVSGSGPWDITIDTTNRVSDENYTPVAGQRVSPWSDSLQAVADSLAGVFDGLGPGELVYPNPLEGTRRIRTPFAPAQWPYRLTEDALEAAVSTSRISQVFDHAVVLGAGTSPPVGTPGTVAYVVALGDLAVHPKT